MKTGKWVWTGLLLVVSLSACSLLERRERVVATIASNVEVVQITVPTTVQRGVPFEVEVLTYGGGCIDQGETEVEVQGLNASVTPYDYLVTPPPGVVCTLIFEYYPHRANLQFDTSGTAEIVFHGQSENLSEKTAITETRTVVVR